MWDKSKADTMYVWKFIRIHVKPYFRSKQISIHYIKLNCVDLFGESAWAAERMDNGLSWVAMYMCSTKLRTLCTTLNFIRQTMTEFSPNSMLWCVFNNLLKTNWNFMSKTLMHDITTNAWTDWVIERGMCRYYNARFSMLSTATAMNC